MMALFTPQLPLGEHLPLPNGCYHCGYLDFNSHLLPTLADRRILYLDTVVDPVTVFLGKPFRSLVAIESEHVGRPCLKKRRRADHDHSHDFGQCSERKGSGSRANVEARMCPADDQTTGLLEGAVFRGS